MILLTWENFEIENNYFSSPDIMKSYNSLIDQQNRSVRIEKLPLNCRNCPMWVSTEPSSTV